MALLVRKGADVNTKDSFGATPLQRAIANGHTDCVNLLQHLPLAPEDKNREIESKSLSLDNLNPEDKAIASDLISLGDDNPDVRYKAYNVLDQKRYEDNVLLSGISRIEAEIPSNDVVTRVRLYCGLGGWLGGNRYTRPKGIELIRHAIELSTNMALPHTLLGTLLMGDSSNLYLEQQNGSSREFPELSQKELELVSRDFHDHAQKELELAIRLNPNDPTPYYIFCKSQFLDFSQLKNQYLRGVQRDKTHSSEFGRYHWSFAIEAAKFNQAGDATDAFLRAMIVALEEYCEGPRSVRPKDGLALSCWQTAKQQIVSYRDNAGKIDTLWLVEKSAPPSDPPAIPVSAPVNNYKAQFSEDEWTTLQCGIYWVFRQLFLIHRGEDADKLTEAQKKAFGTVLQTAPIIKSALARQVLLSLMEERETFTKVWATCFMDPRHPADGLHAVSELVDGKLPTDISLEFKRTLLILGRFIHLEHEKLAGTNLPEKPGALSEPYQCLILVGSSLRILEKELMDDLFHTPMNIYDLPSASPQSVKQTNVPGTVHLSPSVISATAPVKRTEYQQSIQPTITSSNKSPFIAALLSYFLLGGAGQIYLGQWKKGLALMISTFVLSFVFIGILIQVIGIGDAYGVAQKLRKGKSIGEWEFNINWKVSGLVMITYAIAICGIVFLIFLTSNSR